MKEVENYISDVIKGFKSLRAKATHFCYDIKVGYLIIEKLIFNFCNKVDGIVYIVGPHHDTKYIKTNVIKNINVDSSRIKTIDDKYFNYENKLDASFIILLNIEDKNKINYFVSNYDFVLNLYYKRDDNNSINYIKLDDIRKLLPAIPISVNIGRIANIINKSPVEGVVYSINFSDDEYEEYHKHDVFIKESISIFGDLDTINRCRSGDAKHNIGANALCLQVARRNGWSETIDCTVDYNSKIDTYYNPNALRERATIFYNITRNRRDILDNCKSKLNVIEDIVANNKNKRIIIVSKSGNFANDICNHLNEKLGNICVGYHDNVPDDYIIDSNGDIITYKSGAHKGEPKLFKSKALSSRNEQLFNTGSIQCLSIKFSSNRELLCTADVIIFTSPTYDTIEEFRLRFKSVKLNEENTIIYAICINGTQEENSIKQLFKGYNKPTIIDVRDENIFYDENSGNVIL